MIALLAKSLFGGSSVTTAIFLVVGLGLAGYVGTLKFEIWSQGNTIATLENDKRELELSVEYEKGEVKACKAVVDQTNARIEDLREDRETRTRMFDMLQENVDLIRESSSARIADLEETPTPQNCEEAMTLLRNGLGERE